MDQHFFRDGAFLDDGAVGCDVTGQDGNAAGFAVGRFDAVDDVGAENIGVFDELADGLAGHALAGLDNQAQLGQFLHDGRNPAGFVQVYHMVGAAGTELGQVGRLVGNLVEEGQRQADARFVGNGRQVQGRVGAAADGHIHGDGVFKGVQGHDIAGQDLLLDKPYDGFAGLFGQTGPVSLVGGRNSAVSRQAHAEDLCQAVHGVGGEQAGAGTAARTGTLLDVGQFGFVDLAGFETAGCLKGLGNGDVLAIVPARKHGAPTAKYGGNVDTQSRHEHARHDFIAVRNHDHAIEGVAVDQGFNAVRNELAAGQGIFHALVTHGDSIANADGRHFERERRRRPGCRI